MKDIKVGVEKMTRNHRKMIKQTGDSLLLSKHSIQLNFRLSSYYSLRCVRFEQLKYYSTFEIRSLSQPNQHAEDKTLPGYLINI